MISIVTRDHIVQEQCVTVHRVHRSNWLYSEALFTSQSGSAKARLLQMGQIVQLHLSFSVRRHVKVILQYKHPEVTEAMQIVRTEEVNI